jgi:hypothetical protein
MLFERPAEALFNGLTDEAWLQLLVRSVTEPVIDSVEMPRFPHGTVQRRSVGSADEHALKEAFTFWSWTKAWSQSLGRKLHANTTFLDFGCGWGRYARMFWKDVSPQGIHGVDVSSDIVAVCRMLGVPGTFSVIDPKGSLPFENEFFDNIIAYSVFTHLPEHMAQHWMKELARVAKPGCVLTFTVEPSRFLDFINTIPDEAENAWHASLGRFKKDTAEMRKAFDAGDFCYIPTGGGEGLDSSIYADALIPIAYMHAKWGTDFKFWQYIDDPNLFWQAFVVATNAKSR